MFGFAKKFVDSLNSVAEGEESRLGLRVLSVKDDSFLGLESFFDYIIACNGVEISQYLEINTQTGTVSTSNWTNYMDYEANLNNDISLQVYSAKGNVERTVTIKATQYHQQAGLGVSVQLTPLKTAQYVWHVLRVQPKSPAYVAGIMPDEYILQCENGLLATGGEELLSKVIQSQYVKNEHQPVEVVLYVYNYEADCVRPVRVVIREDWGGRGLLGCDIGYGLLHRIPEKFRIVSQSEVTTEDVVLEQPPQYLEMKKDIVTPSFQSDSQEAAMDSLQDLTKVVNSSSRARKHRPSVAHNTAIDEYMKEQSEVNKGVDSNSSRQGETHVPPPPPPPSKKNKD